MSCRKLWRAVSSSFQWHKTGRSRWQPESGAAAQSVLDRLEGWAEVSEPYEIQFSAKPCPWEDRVSGSDPAWVCLAGGQLYRKVPGVCWQRAERSPQRPGSSNLGSTDQGRARRSKCGLSPSAQHLLGHIQILYPVLGSQYRKDCKLRWIQWRTTRMLAPGALAKGEEAEELEVVRPWEETALRGYPSSLTVPTRRLLRRWSSSL